jgi:hypothetical protein
MPFSNRKLGLMVFFSLLVIILKVVIIMKYSPLGVDGGWASYPALSLSRGGSAIEDFKDIDYLKRIPGLAIKFGYFDSRSVRLFPLSLWFKTFGTGLSSCRFYSILEYLLLITAVIFFLRCFSTDKKLVIMVGSLYAIDRTVLSCIGDLRPDTMLTALALLGFIFFHKSRDSFSAPAYWIGIALLSIMSLIWITAILSLSMIFFYFLFKDGFGKQIFRIKKIMLLIIFIGIPTLVLLAGDFFNNLFFGKIIAPEPNSWYKPISQLWAEGTKALFSKEMVRWSGYFLYSSVGILLTICLAFIIILFNFRAYGEKPVRVFFGLCAAIASACLMLLMVDPHTTVGHSINVVPFLFAVIVVVFNSRNSLKARYYELFYGLFLFSVILGVLSSVRVGIINQRSGYENSKVSALMGELMPSKNESFVCIGPTALFPYMSPEGNLTMLDDRIGFQLDSINPLALKYVFIDREYLDFNFEEKFRKRFREFDLVPVKEIGNPDYSYLKVMMVKRNLTFQPSM